MDGLTFANSRHLVDRAEWDHWNGTAELTGPDPDAVQKPLSSVIEFLNRDQEIVPGVRVCPRRATHPDTPACWSPTQPAISVC